MADELLKPNYFESSTQYHPTNTDLMKMPTDDIYALQKLATQYKKDGDLAGALACLYEVRNTLEDFDDPQYFSVTLRLALYLQSAGKFEAAKFELQSLIDEIDDIVELKVGHHSEDKDYEEYYKSTKSYLLSEILDTARKIYKREKLNDEANNFENLATKFRLDNQERLKYLGEQRAIRLQEWREEREKDRQELEQWRQEQAELKQQEKDKKRTNFWLYTGLGFIVYLLIKHFAK